MATCFSCGKDIELDPQAKADFVYDEEAEALICGECNLDQNSQQKVMEKEVCTWDFISLTKQWLTDCQRHVKEHALKENSIHYCPYCGLLVRKSKPKEEEE